MNAVALKDPIVELARDEADISNDIADAAREAGELLVQISAKGYAIESATEKDFIETTMQQLASKAKFLDDERKISVTPLNKEVDRINDWYRPALTTIKQLSEQAKQVLGAYILKQKREAERLKAEAEAKVTAALAASSAAALAESNAVGAAQAATALTTATTAAKALMTQSAQTSQTVQNQKGSAVTHKPVWKFRIKNAASLPREFLMPNEKAIGEHVAKHGDKNVPAGVEVFEDVSFRISKK